MPPAPQKLQPALYGGVFIGVLSALPLVGAGNCICCLWVVSGGALALYLLQQNHPYPVTAADGALVGLLAGVIGGVLWVLISIPISMAMGPVTQQMIQRLVLDNPEVPEQTKDMVRNMGGTGAVSAAATAISLVLYTCVGAIFGMLGGLLGVALFKKKDVPPGTTEILPPA